MDLMRNPFACSALCLGLMIGVACNSLDASVQPRMVVVAFPAQQQQQQPTAEAPVANAPEQSSPDGQGLSLSDQVIKDVLAPLSTGLQTQNIQLIMSIFDSKELTNYSDLQGQLRAFFHQYDQVNFRYQVLQVTADKDRGSATADLDMDALPYELGQVPSRRTVQMRFKLKQEPKGWKVTSFSPSGFFNVEFNPTGGQ